MLSGKRICDITPEEKHLMQLAFMNALTEQKQKKQKQKKRSDNK